MNLRRWNPWIGLALVASAALAGCTPKTTVSTTGNVPAAYSHVFLSVKEVWFHTSATAGPDDASWIKFPLNTPVTVDLATSVGGTVSSIISGLSVPIGTYAQVRLIPVDSGATLLSSASDLGAIYNSEVEYTDSSSTLHQIPLELQNPDRGIGIATAIEVKTTGTKVFASASSSSTSSTTTGSTSTTASTSTNTTFSLAINIDGAKDLVPFTYTNVSGMLLNPHATAYDTSLTGAIQGTLKIAGLTGLTSPSTSSYVNIQVTAESLSTDGTRHVAVNSAPVRSDGTFTLYPLATSSSSPASYDLVIHGPAIATIIVKGVTVTVGDPSTSTTTAVTIGTVTPRAASSFTVNLNTTNPIQAGALVGFYQTVPGSSEVPYLIEQQAIDPFSYAFAADRALSASSLDYGTFSSGSDVSLTTAAPTEGTGTYRVAATAPLFADGVLTTMVTAPSASTTVATVVAVPVLSVASSALSGTTTLQVSQTTPKKYDRGGVIISHDGAIVATAALDSILAQSATSNLTISGLPAGATTSGTTSSSALYYVSVRVWKSTDPAGSLTREVYPTALDLRSGSITSYSLNID